MIFIYIYKIYLCPTIQSVLEATNEFGTVHNSSPDFKSSAKQATCSALVALLVACVTFTNFGVFSNFFTIGPVNEFGFKNFFTFKMSLSNILLIVRVFFHLTKVNNFSIFNFKRFFRNFTYFHIMRYN